MSLAVLIALVAALAMWMRSRSRPIQVDDPPEWPPLPPSGDDAAASNGATASDTAAEVPTPEVPTPEAPAAETTETAPSAPAGTVWRAADDDGACPDGYPIKANESSGIFHVPGGRFYDRTNPDRCYPDAASAIADGYRQAKT